jgi:protein gp37
MSSSDTKIEWTDKTWNPVRGCSIISPGCRECYAMKDAHRFAGLDKHGKKLPYFGLTKMTAAGPQWTGEVRFIPDTLDEPLTWRKPQRIFVNSMSDLFHEKLDNEDIAAVFGVMALAPRHTFQILTKRAERMRDWFKWVEKRGQDGLALFPDDPEDWRIRQMLNVAARKAGVDMNPAARQNRGGDWPLPNVWLGVSVENQEQADKRIPLLLETPAAVRFLSCEPLLGPVDLGQWLGKLDYVGSEGGQFAEDPQIDWAIIGGESGSSKKVRSMELGWMQSLVQQARAAKVAVFCKQFGSKPYETMPILGGKGYGVGGDLHEVMTAPKLDAQRQGWTRVTTKGEQFLQRTHEVKHPKGGDITEIAGDWPREYPVEVHRG